MDTKKILVLMVAAMVTLSGISIYFFLEDDDEFDLRVSYLKKSAYETQIIADYKDHFSQNGLKVESVPVSGSGSDSVNMLLSGYVDIANTGEGPVASAIKDHGDRIIVLCATNVYTGGQVWIADSDMTGDRGIVPYDKSMDNKDQVRDSFISASSEGSIKLGVQRGSTTESEVKSWLDTMDIDYNDFGEEYDRTVTLVNVKANTLVMTMSAGDIDILAASQPYPDNAIELIPGSYRIGSNADIDSYGLSVYITTKEVYAEKANIIRNFISGLKDATDFMNDPKNYAECTSKCAEVCGTNVNVFESAWAISNFQIGWTDQMATSLYNASVKKGADVTLDYCKTICPKELKDYMEKIWY